MSRYTTRIISAPHTTEHRAFLEQDGNVLSAWHDIPLFANESTGVINVVVTVPRWTNAKMEVSLEEAFNPIRQEVRRGKLRYVRNCFPHHGYIWNYGALPQTREQQSATGAGARPKANTGPLDVCEIGSQIGHVGQVKEAKVLGMIELVDDGRTSWKILAIDLADPLAASLNDVEDLDALMPGLIQGTCEWFRVYEIPNGKVHHPSAFSCEIKNKEAAMEVIDRCHEAWRRLVSGERPAGTSPNSLSTAYASKRKGYEHVSPQRAVHAGKPAVPTGSSISKSFHLLPAGL